MITAYELVTQLWESGPSNLFKWTAEDGEIILYTNGHRLRIGDVFDDDGEFIGWGFVGETVRMNYLYQTIEWEQSTNLGLSNDIDVTLQYISNWINESQKAWITE